MPADPDEQRRLLAREHAHELAAAYDDARLACERPLLLLVQREDSLGRRILEQWLPRPPKWLRRVRRMDPEAFQSDFHIFVRELEEVAAWFVDAGVDDALGSVRLGGLTLVVVAFEGVSVCGVSLAE